MSVGVTLFRCDDVSGLNGTVLVNGHVFMADDPIEEEVWAVGTTIAVRPTTVEGWYKLSAGSGATELFFQHLNGAVSLFEEGPATHLKKTHWFAEIDNLDCAGHDPSAPIAHEVHEVVMKEGRGVFVTPSSWAAGDQLSLRVDEFKGESWLINHTQNDGWKLP